MDAVDRSLFVRFSSDLLSGKIDASDHRHDLGSSAGEKEEDAKKEFIPQIMWPSLYLEGGTEQSALHRKVVEASRYVYILLEYVNSKVYMDSNITYYM